METFPPPHRILYEPLNDQASLELVAAYTAAHRHEADVETVDAAHMNSMDDFAKWVTQWMAFAPSRPSIRCRLLVVWHAHLLSLACQQMLRRSLEQRSFRCRVWFHIEEPTIQAALVSRCIVTRLSSPLHRPRRVGPPFDQALWIDPRATEMELHTPKE